MLRFGSWVAGRFTVAVTLHLVSSGRSSGTCRAAFWSSPLSAQGVRWVCSGPASIADGECGKNLNSSRDDCSGASAVRRAEPTLRRLSVVRPDLVDEWVPELNDSDVSVISCTSTLEVWWRCKLCGGNYQATVRDRAIGGKGCTQCTHERQNQQGKPFQAHCKNNDCSGASAEERSSTLDTKVGSLLETHPSLAERWDTEKNGLLRPSDVTCESDLCVWWKPAPGRPPHEKSFRRPVYAFVETPYSREEQLDAQAVLELDILRQVRHASKIVDSGENKNLPAAARMLDEIVFGEKNSGDSAADASVSSSAHTPLHVGKVRDNHCGLVGEDISKAVDLWESRYDSEEDVGHRRLFHLTDTRDGAQASREQILNIYEQFVSWHRRRAKSRGQASSDTKVAGGTAASETPSAIPSVLRDPDWLQYFTLNLDDVLADRFSPSAKLIFQDALDGPTGQQCQQKGEGCEMSSRRHRIETLPPPPEEYEDGVRTAFAANRRLYPRKPPLPPAREDDVTETLPKSTETKNRETNTIPRKVRAVSSNTSRKELPLEATFDVVNLSNAQSLVQEYVGTSEDRMLFDAGEEEEQPNTLLGTTAIGAMTNEQARALQYNRGNPRPRNVGRFRLRPPVDFGNTGNRIRMKDRSASMSGEAPLSLSSSQVARPQEEEMAIQAPGVPRKVSRPKKMGTVVPLQD
ncbi:hypothetical protein ERJ75_001029300 [Trypanosoma vivax]|uniref:Treble clef zinc finger domain-containing protein n=1 Tax=Trypanosoma vivax (strain Y486) TaxID=1055687 RepID=G0TR68_TRYVY|nr:hypothetical protein TRVL_08206 [Trypanosoma vivax]KAH8611199.1 hypothetical protein ERJ75_001029300 [Trypanosoma vivax]CCC46432.1 conserved hypothetical protein [Trypanosoma vivax Y486]